MVCKTKDFYFDPDKTALQNLFALIFRTNRIRLSENDLDVGVPVAVPEDEHGDNTTIKVVGKPGGAIKGEATLWYARADIESHYPSFEIDLIDEDVARINSVDALIHYLDGRFNLVDGEFDVDIKDPFNSLFDFLQIDLMANEDSYIYIGSKTIHLFWSGGLRRMTEDGQIRMTDDGQYRVITD